MTESWNIKIGSKDVIWNYLATFLQIGSGLLLFPLILHKLDSSIVGIWSVFMAISSLVSLLDFGFAPSFTRNISYIFSGVSKLEKNGVSTQESGAEINFELLNSTIKAMKWFYTRIALITFFILIGFGSWYIYNIVSKNALVEPNQISIAWIIFCVVNTFNIYTLYYDALLLGCGKVKQDKQIIILSQSAYLLITAGLIYSGFGLIGIVSGQAVSILIRRFASTKTFYTSHLKNLLAQASSNQYKEIIKVISPNAIKVGITGIGAFMVLQSSVIIGALFLPIQTMATYGISTIVINVIASLGTVYYTSYITQIAQYRVNNNLKAIKKQYLRSILILTITFVLSGTALVFFGQYFLNLLQSQTQLLCNAMLITLLGITFLEKNHAIAGGFLLSNNEVPYFKAAILSGISTVILLYIMLKYFNMGIWGIILAPGIVQLSYQNWKWPIVLLNQLNKK